MTHSALGIVIILLGLSVPLVALLRRWQLPPILAYLFIGMAVGPHALGWIPDAESIHMLAEIGVVFLLFMLGLEFSVPMLLAMRGAVFGLGGAQVVLMTLLGTCLLWLFDASLDAAFVAGGALALSSTAIAVRQLTEQLEMHGRHGRLALAILLFQDLAVAPFLVVIPILAAGDGQLWLSLLLALLKGGATLGLMYLIGHRILRPLFHTVAATRSSELFTLAALLVALAAAWITYSVGLSLALGAFMAGLLLGDTEYKHQVETDIRPFRDVLMGLFFVSIGSQMNFPVLPELWHWIALLLILVVPFKILLISTLVRATGNEPGVALRTGISLGQGSEFGFALLFVALHAGLISNQVNQAVSAAIILSMVIAPLLIRYNGRIAEWIYSGQYRRGQHVPTQELEKASAGLNDHVIICGFERIGQNLARFLDESGIDYIALDLDATLVREAWEAGERVYFADAGNIDNLEKAALARARAVVLTYNHNPQAERIIRTIRQNRGDVPIIVRTQDDEQMEQLLQAGATEVLPGSMLASLIMADRLLSQFGVPENEIQSMLDKARANHYSRLRGFFHGASAENIEESNKTFLRTVVLPPDCYASGRTLGSIGLPAQVSVTALRRGQIRGESPQPEMLLQANDALILQGPPDELERAEKIFLSG